MKNTQELSSLNEFQALQKSVGGLATNWVEVE